MNNKRERRRPAPKDAVKRNRGSGKPRSLSPGRIVVPIDFSGNSRQALEIAVPLAKQYGGRIFLLHVVEPPAISAWRAVPGGQHYLTMQINNMVGAAQKELETLAARRVPVELRGRTLVCEGNPYSEITSAALRLKADLIVISTHGHTGMRRMLIGSVAERVVRHAPCAVLTVRQRQRKPVDDDLLMPSKKIKPRNETAAPRRLGWQRILVPIDFSKTALRALEVAVPLARDPTARVVLLSVIEPVGFTAGMESVAMVIPDSVIAREAEDNLRRIRKRFIPPTVRVTLLVDRGRASDVIARVAKAENIDLIVLTTHGRTGLNRLLMGSTAEQVVRHARCPVFIVRTAPRTNKNQQMRND